MWGYLTTAVAGTSRLRLIASDLLDVFAIVFVVESWQIYLTLRSDYKNKSTSSQST
jgi:hypothetical protein